MIHEDGSASSAGVVSAGIILQPYPSNYPQGDDFTSTGDTVYNEGINGTGIGAVISTGWTYPAFHGLRVYDTQATPTMVQAIGGSCNADCTIDGTQTFGFANPWAGLVGNLGAARVSNNQGGLSNYIQSDTVFNGNSTTFGIGIFGGGLRATLLETCSGQPTGTIYDDGDHVARVCP